jgi:hypothetical protein
LDELAYDLAELRLQEARATHLEWLSQLHARLSEFDTAVTVGGLVNHTHLISLH